MTPPNDLPNEARHFYLFVFEAPMRLEETVASGGGSI
jgi:hypothetical protein